ncbi:hypothetical protein JCM1840_005039 [Sporobolomyces johnsonii]
MSSSSVIAQPAPAPSTSTASGASLSTVPPPSETLLALEHALPSLGASKAAENELRNLAAYRAPSRPTAFPTARLAAVLVLLHLTPEGELGVTLTTRSMRLRSHPGETALPGGRWEEGDEGVEGTALREANEEIALPLPPPTSSSAPPSHLLHLTTLAAYTSRTLLVVIPCVYLLLEPSPSAEPYLAAVLQKNEDEVDAIFHARLGGFLGLPAERTSTGAGAGAGEERDPPSSLKDELAPPSSSAGRMTTRSQHPSLSSPSPIPVPGDTYTYTYRDFTWLLSRPYRLHSFASPAFPSAVTGLTADICIDVACIAAYGPRSSSSSEGKEEEEKGRQTGFARTAEGQMSWDEITAEALRMPRGVQKGLLPEAPGRGGDQRTSAT